MNGCLECDYMRTEREGIDVDSHATVAQAIERNKSVRCDEHRPRAARIKSYFKLMKEVVDTAGKDTIE